MDPKRLAILKLISEDSALEDHFFKTKKNPVWFFELKKRGYFDASKNPMIQPADREGYYVIPQWNVLEYLEKIAEQTNIPENEKYINELLQIIESVSTYKNVDGKIIDNYRTWWFFIKILLKLPNDKIPNKILEFLPVWLNSQYGSSLVDADAAKKLLPKFLHPSATPEDIKKAEKIIDYLTDFIWVKKRGVFTAQEEEADGVVEDHWLIDSFLEDGLAKLIGELCDKDIIYKLAEKVKKILYHKVNSRINVDHKGLTYRLSVKIEQDFKYQLSVSTYKKKTANGEEDFRDDFSIEAKELYTFEINAKDSNTFIKELTSKLENIDLPSDVKVKMQSSSQDFYRYIYQDYSYIWFKSFSSLPSPRRLHDFKHVLLTILVESYFKLQNSKPEIAKEITDSFLSDKFQHQVFRRLAITLVAKNWSSYKSIFWDELIVNTVDPILEDPAFEDEIRFLFYENVGKFTMEEKNRVDSLIARGPQKYLIEDNKEKYILYWKQRWYSSLKEDQFFAEKYQSIKNISGYQDEREKAQGESIWVGPGPSPLTEEEILSTSNQELALVISKFQERDLLGKGPSAEGFGKALEGAAQKKPEKFTENMDPFIDIGFFYLDYILDGFKKAWSNKISFDWSKLLKFLNSYINRPVFWKNKLTVKAGFYSADYKTVLGAFGELVQEGTKDDEWSIPSEDFPILKEIFLSIAQNAGKDDKKARDFPNHLINCGLGKANIGLLYLTLRLARIQKNNGRPVWDTDLKNIFEALLSRGIYDAFTVLGENLINFVYLDKAWTEKHIKEISDTKNIILWEAFMSGYLASSKVNLDVYRLMKKNYIKALSFNFDESILSERLIDHIGIGYLNGAETINGDGLLKIIWKKWKSQQIRALISFFWSQRTSLIEKVDELELDKKMRQRIIKFWRDVYERNKDKQDLSKDEREILSDVVRLAAFIAEIDDENYKWLLLSAPYVQDHYESPYLLERLNELKDKGNRKDIAQKIANIYIEILKSYKPDYDIENIRSIIKFLYETNDPEIKELANHICNEYAKSGIDIITDIYNENNHD